MADDGVPAALRSLSERSAVVDAWDIVSEAWGAYTAGPHDDALIDLSHAGCKAGRLIADDGEFWASLHDVVREVERRPELLRKGIEDLDRFIGGEVDIATAVLGPERAGRLQRDLGLSLARMRETPELRARDIEQLRAGVSNLTEDLCRAAELDAQDEPGRLGRIVRGAARVVRVAGGGALIVVNGVGAAGLVIAPIAIPAAVGSVVAGAGAVQDGLKPDQRCKKRRGPFGLW